MVKNLLKSGKIIYPKKLILKKNLNVGIIGSGTIANEYAKIISSFGHKLIIIISKSNNRNAIRPCFAVSNSSFECVI